MFAGRKADKSDRRFFSRFMKKWLLEIRQTSQVASLSNGPSIQITTLEVVFLFASYVVIFTIFMLASDIFSYRTTQKNVQASQCK